MTDRRPRVAFVGDETLAAECAQLAIDHGLDVVAVATRHVRVREWAAAAGVAPLDPDALAAALAPLRLDVLFSVANLRVLGPDVLATAPLSINFHDGPLPTYAGRNVTSWAILAGEERHCVTWHVMTDEVDEGAVLAEEWFDLAPDDTAFSLNARCFEAGLRSFPAVADMVAVGTAAGAARLPSNRRPGPGHHFGRFERPGALGLLDPRRPAAELARAVRAFDLGARQVNPLGALRVVVGDSAWLVARASVQPAVGDAEVGHVIAVTPAGVRVRTGHDDVVLEAFATLAGAAVEVLDVCARAALLPGGRLPSPDAALAVALDAVDPDLARHERASARRLRLASPTALQLPAPAVAASGRGHVAVTMPTEATADDIVAGIAIWLARWSNRSDVVVTYIDTAVAVVLHGLAPLVAPPLLSVDVSGVSTFAELRAATAEAGHAATEAGPWLIDLVARTPDLRARPPLPAGVAVIVGADHDLVAPDAALRFLVHADGGALRIDHRLDVLDAAQATRVGEQLATVIGAAVVASDRPVADLPMVGAMEMALLHAANATERPVDATATVVAQIAAQCGRTPDAPALTAGTVTLTYEAMYERVERLALALAAAGVRRGDRVGIALPRSIELVVAALAVQRTGAAYVPLDPSYPHDRLTFMVDDAHLVALVAEPQVAARLGRPGVAVVHPHAVTDQAAELERPAPGDVAYVIYTSGSTGTPKGVVLEHRQVVNFFAAMDEVIDQRDGGVWLAVTSLSFDISVLELLWTLSRGFHVVVAAEPGARQAERVAAVTAVPASASATGPSTPMAFSFFYFSAEDTGEANPYRLLLEGARYADEHGFVAVWTPERHFHAFGGLYPNPSVTGAAVAAITKHVAIRGGSCVLPLHSPIRVAEEWAVVDRLSGGRVGVAFASGWHPNDFVVRPEGHLGARESVVKGVRTVQQLWRGETLTFPGADGAAVSVSTLPRPVQAELPVWLTTAGSLASFVRAGHEGFHVLTHLLGQRVEDLGPKIDAYRAAWRAAGHVGQGQVALMLHTYLGDDHDEVHQRVRGPMASYLRTAVGLIGNNPSAFPTFTGASEADDAAFTSLSPDEVEQLLDVAVTRYVETSGLFGEPERVAPLVAELRALGVDEIACLLDFGVETDAVIASFDHLRHLKELEEARAAVIEPVVFTSAASDTRGLDLADADTSVASLIAAHGVTHLQCTPSLAAMLTADPADRAAIAGLAHVLVGGEALSVALAADLRRLVAGRITNMYGPTETTIWSLVHEITAVPDGPVPIGRPVANTMVHVLDDHGQPRPIGALGELHIGGAGVARGYLDRPELTSARFVERPGLGRVYATGDLARLRPSGIVDFAGRRDDQVKLRGHRIELGEIETCLDAHATVGQVVVVARTQDGAVGTLVAYVVASSGAVIDAAALRDHVAARLPEIMVPSSVVVLDRFPLTPNGKVDRHALPVPGAAVIVASVAGSASVAAMPAGEAEEIVAAVWSELLSRPVGRDDNFFDLGGHSLLAVRVFRRLVDATAAPLALTDIFRFPTVRTLAAHLSRGAATATPDASSPPVAGADRGALRRQALSRRGPPEPGAP